MSTSEALTRQQKADAIRSVKELLLQVRTDWTYAPPRPPPPAPVPSRTLSSASSASAFSRSGVLGAWRPAAPEEPIFNEKEAEDSWDDDWNSTEESDSSDDDDIDDAPKKRGASSGVPQRALSYRRATTPPPAARRNKRKRKRRDHRREGTWKQRTDDSDYEIPTPVPSSAAFKWDSPKSIAPHKARRRHERELMRENPGLRTWLRRRDQWTGADSEGWVPVGESRFASNPLAKLVTPQAYPDIYQRCVVRSGELPVPVNLAKMVDALVVGWKSDDMWPPKPTPAEAGITAGRVKFGANNRGAPGQEDSGVKSMSGKVRKYLGIR